MTPTLEYYLISEELSPKSIGDKVLGYRNYVLPFYILRDADAINGVFYMLKQKKRALA